MARATLSLGILAPRALRRARRRRGLRSGSPPPILAAMAISLLILAKIRLRLASMAPLKCLTLAHLLCPAIGATAFVQSTPGRVNLPAGGKASLGVSPSFGLKPGWGPGRVGHWPASMNDIKTVEILLIEDNAGDARLAKEALRDAKVRNNLTWIADGI